jgi:hypothetical protein
MIKGPERLETGSKRNFEVFEGESERENAVNAEKACQLRPKGGRSVGMWERGFGHLMKNWMR